MNGDPLLNEEQLGSATFDLFSSSTLSRYARVAREHAVRTGLSNRLLRESDFGPQVIERAKLLWSEAATDEQRGLAEVELAILLAAVDQLPVVPGARRLVETIAASKQLASGWIPSMAGRWLARHRPHRVQQDVKWSPGRGHRAWMEAPCI